LWLGLTIVFWIVVGPAGFGLALILSIFIGFFPVDQRSLVAKHTPKMSVPGN